MGRRKYLTENLHHHYLKDIFIHGVDNGKIKSVRKKLEIIIPIVFLIIFVILYLEDVPDQEIVNERKKSEMAKFIVH